MRKEELDIPANMPAHCMQANQNCVPSFIFCYFDFRALILVWLLFRIVMPSSLWAQQKNATYENYIRQYSHLAVREEKKFHIPASITLAQALLESAAGQSVLAQQSNNHFGIKCHNEWKGKRYYKNAEKPNECFRKYNSVKDAYADHSLFLTSRSHYQPLFQLKKNDYVHWAKGLQSCGYATDRQYADKLIRLIETYQLYRYDGKPRKGAARRDPDNKPTEKIYGLKYVVAKRGDSFESLAGELHMKAEKLAKYNEVPVDFPLREGDYVYLEKKRKKAVKPYLNHQVRSGESMYFIAQRYGIQMKSLYKMNRKDDDYMPGVGDLLKLR
jgi:LysM repeat protein